MLLSLPLLLLSSALATAAPAPVPRLEDLARSIKSSYCAAVQPEGKIIARGEEDVKWILTEHADSVRLSLGSIHVDELLERMTDQVTFSPETDDEDDYEQNELDEEEPAPSSLDASRLHPSFHAYVPDAEAAHAALAAHLASRPCPRWRAFLGRCPAVELTGHGLGGALALLIAEHLPAQTRVTTFGMPALLDDAPHHENWVNGLDPVSRFLDGGRRAYMKDAHAEERFEMRMARLGDHHAVHGVSLEC